MLIKLMLPILFPSWRFFSSIGPSPRIEVGFVVQGNTPPLWLPFRPLPEKISFLRAVQRLFHNPRWNELLYINTCAEHLFENNSEFFEQEIGMRLVNAVLNKEIIAHDESQYLVFRIRALTSEAGQLRDDIVFLSRLFVLTETR